MHEPLSDRLAIVGYLIGYTLAMAVGFGMVIVYAYVVVP